MKSVEHFCNVLARSGLLPPDRIRELRRQWLNGPGAQDAALEKFLTWLPSTGALTEYQVGVLSRGHVDQLFLGPYTIQERIGKGRVAGVYKAVHETGYTAAIKVLPPSRAKDPQVLARFLREARLAQRLSHPNVVRTFQGGGANGLYFLAMEHLEGELLDQIFQRRGPLPPGEAVRLAHQLLGGLQCLHEQDMVHRDVKPSNLMLVGGRPDRTLDGTLKILDIGTGRALFDDAPGSALTNEDDVLGTPCYMAPEQARDSRSVDIRADIYSAGCVLYHALAGRPPFNDANSVRLLIRHATEEPQPVRELNPAVPEGLQQVLAKMLAKAPDRRYPTPAHAAAALQPFLPAGAAVVPPKRDPSVQSGQGRVAVQPDDPSLAGALECEIVEEPVLELAGDEDVFLLSEDDIISRGEVEGADERVRPARKRPAPPPSRPRRQPPRRDQED